MSSRRSILTLTVIVGSQLWAPGFAAAQTAPADQPAGTATSAPAPAPAETATAPAKTKMGEEIVVTGSRIRRKDLTTPAPVTVLSREQMQQSGKVTLGDFLQSLPEQGNALNTSVNNGSDGSVRIDLRSLGQSRTLVLVNGRRMVAGGTGADNAVDLSSIPTAAIERIEILKDGASAVYGSDAVAGVVNIITRKRFTGAEGTVTFGTSQHGGGTTTDVNASFGHADEKGSIFFAGGYYKQNPVFADQRSYSATPYAYDATGNSLGEVGQQFVGSGTVPAGTFSLSKSEKGGADGTGNAAWQSLMAQCTQTDRTKCPSKYINDPTAPGGWRPFVNGPDTYNFQPWNYLITPQERFQLFSTGDYQLVPEYVRFFYEASFVNRKGAYQIAPEPFATSNEGLTVSADNYYNPFGRDFSVVAKRMSEVGGRGELFDNDTWRVVAGVDGNIAPLNNWFYEASVNYGRNTSVTDKRGNLFLPSLAAALGPSMLVDGKPACVSKPGDASTVIEGCVPLNMFGGLNSITSDQVAGITFNGPYYGFNEQLVLAINSSGELPIRLLSERPVALAFGYEHRRLKGGYQPDPITEKGLTSGNKEQAAHGEYYANEGYGELSIPVISGVTGVDNLELSIAGRVFGYSNFGSDATYKVGARYSPFPDLTLRGTYGTAYRAPSIGNLYGGNYDSFDGGTDPCAATTGTPANCGVAAGNGDESSQFRAIYGGNPKLVPETAKIFTAGLVVEPTFFKGFTATVDYYNIEIEKTIGQIGTSLIIQSCYPADASVTPKYCDLITRNPATNYISSVVNTLQNVGKDETAGIDFAFRYARPTASYGRFGFLFDGTWLQKWDRTLADGSVQHYKGNFDLGSGTVGGALPEFKFNAGVTWALAGFNAGVSQRFLSDVTECGDADGFFYQGTGNCNVDKTYARKSGVYTNWDLFVGYGFNTVAGQTSLAAGVNNLFDAAPRYLYTGLNHYDGTVYDLMGRYFWVRLTQSI